MTASLPQEVQAVFDRFITTERTPIDLHGQPITWPVTPYWRNADLSAQPELFDAHMEEVRSCRSEEPPRFHASKRELARRR